MANNLDKFYNVFTGLDTRSNKLLQSPGSFRKGSKNFKYDFQDQISNRNGLQHKDSSAPAFVDIFEYKYRNVDTGAAETEILGVATNGNLYRKLNSTLSFTATGAATSVSIYYDEVADTFKCVMNGLGSVTITPTMTLADLETALELLAGVTITVTGDSAQLAYLLDCVIEDTTFADNVVYYWEVVPFPDISCVSVSSVTEANFDMTDPAQWTQHSVPFKTTVKAQDQVTYPEVAESYEGISSVNLNNCIYITDGGFPMKYDGKCVYRAGMPKQAQGILYPTITGMSYNASATPAGLVSLTSGVYRYKARFGFTDYNGSTYYGDIIELSSPITPVPINPGAMVNITTKGIYYGQDFPTFCAKINGAQSTGINGAGVTITVHSGHNILPGMVARQIIQFNGSATADSTSTTQIGFYAKVTAVTATTITLEETINSSSPEWNSDFDNNAILQAYFVNPIYENLRPSSTQYAPPGAFLEVYRTKVDTDGPYYLVDMMPVPHKQGDVSSIYDDLTDANLSILFDDQEPGYEIPRACKYISQFQNQLVQSGYPADATLRDERYPSVSDPSTSTAYSQPSFDLYTYYTESFLCDLQSVYWADSLAPEGFSQDGIHEFAIDTKFADKITGIAPNKDSLFAFKERSTAVLSGDLAQNDVVMEVLEADAGCISHKTIEEVRGSLVWLDGINGFYSCVAGRLPENIGFPIQDYQKINTEKLDFSQASAANFRKESLYVCSVGTTTFVFDYADNGSLKRNCWYLWDGFNGQSVLATSNDELLIFDGTRTQKLKNTKTIYDFTDHKTAISFILNTAWATQGFPTIDKHYVNLWINSIQGDFTLTVKQYGNFLEDQVASQSDVSFIAESSAKKAIKEPVKAYLPKLSAISFGMENSEKNKWVRIQGYEIQYSPDFNTGEPKR